MRHKYETRGIVLARTPVGEANAIVTVLTEELGLVRARAQGLRKPGAKLAAALATFVESSFVLVRGKEGWRVAGAVLESPWFTELGRPDARCSAARVCGLLLRLVAGDGHPELFAIIAGFFAALTPHEAELIELTEGERDAAEALAVLRILAVLGLDAGDIPGGSSRFDRSTLSGVAADRAVYIARINRGIAASDL